MEGAPASGLPGDFLVCALCSSQDEGRAGDEGGVEGSVAVVWKAGWPEPHTRRLS